MMKILKVDHVGIRVRDADRAVAFYGLLGFETQWKGAFHKGHPIIMQHPSGVVINLLGPTSEPDGPNVLMDVETRSAGYTHVALRVESLEEAKAFLAEHDIAITGKMDFGDLHAVFIRDPDRNVIELDAYPNAESGTRAEYDAHP